MKKRLLTIVLTAFGAFSAFAQFTAGNLAVYRYGDGTAMTNGTRVPVFVDEYTPTGTFVKTITIPRTAANGNYGFEGLGLTTGGGFEAEGFPVLSKDGNVLSIIGYNPEQSGQFVIGTLTATGNWLANTLVVDAIGAPRSAVVEGTNVYFNGYDGGVRYKALGTTDASIRVSTGQDAPRVLTIAETIYGTNESVRIFAPIGGANQATLANVELPTSPVGFGTTPNMPGTTNRPYNIHQAMAFKAYGRTYLYIIDDNNGSPVIRKYRSNGGGNDWVNEFGFVGVPVNTKSFTAKFDAATGVKLYFTTLGTAGSQNSQLYVLNDDFTSANAASKVLSGTPTLIATAPANTTFRGVTMAPTGTSVLPVKLTAFNANEKNGTIRLNWSTASETDASHYNILRSSTASDFVKIDQVSAKGTTNTTSNYSFVDETPLPGTNYYKLQQVDFNGDNETFGPVSATIPVAKTDFSIAKDGANVTVNIYSAKTTKGKIEIADLNGKINYTQSISLEKGYNRVNISSSKLPKGLNVVVLNTTEGKVAKKTIL
ncbi:MAG: hypothetical protein REI64_11110 [Pedobacter sp.]|uniref:hypothetical protein n=1 Tax=Pedobacter sp. TaxID=1411316 RepID=UPI00280A201C|nr:hypothetical protein [Pedobacter sp.]MDQ8005341.1 hypothetical protein [Pedobacter sp.]